MGRSKKKRKSEGKTMCPSEEHFIPCPEHRESLKPAFLSHAGDLYEVQGFIDKATAKIANRKEVCKQCNDKVRETIKHTVRKITEIGKSAEKMLSDMETEENQKYKELTDYRQNVKRVIDKLIVSHDRVDQSGAVVACGSIYDAHELLEWYNKTRDSIGDTNKEDITVNDILPNLINASKIVDEMKLAFEVDTTLWNKTSGQNENEYYIFKKLGELNIPKTKETESIDLLDMSDVCDTGNTTSTNIVMHQSYMNDICVFDVLSKTFQLEKIRLIIFQMVSIDNDRYIAVSHDRKHICLLSNDFHVLSTQISSKKVYSICYHSPQSFLSLTTEDREPCTAEDGQPYTAYIILYERVLYAIVELKTVKVDFPEKLTITNMRQNKNKNKVTVLSHDKMYVVDMETSTFVTYNIHDYTRGIPASSLCIDKYGNTFFGDCQGTVHMLDVNMKHSIAFETVAGPSIFGLVIRYDAMYAFNRNTMYMVELQPKQQKVAVDSGKDEYLSNDEEQEPVSATNVVYLKEEEMAQEHIRAVCVKPSLWEMMLKWWRGK